MSGHAKEIERLRAEGRQHRDELAFDVASVRESARRAGPWLVAAAGAAAAAGVAFAVSSLVRRFRGGRGRARRALDGASALVRKLRPRPLPVALLFGLLRSPAARRALASAGASLVQRAGADARPRPPSASPPAREAPEHASAEGDPSSVAPPPATLPAPSEPRAEQKAAETLNALGRAPFSAKLRFGAGLVRDALRKFREDEAFTRGAALAYYTVLSLAPLLLIVVAVAGLAFGVEAVRARILSQIGELAGADAAQTIGTLMRKASKPSSGILAAIVGVGSLLVGAGGVFGYLQKMLNKIWGVPEKTSEGILHAIRTRFLSLAMVLGTGFLLLVSLVVSAALSAVGDRIGRQFSSGVGVAFNAAHQIVSWAIVGLLFALIFRFLPDTRIAWRDVWIGAGLTSLLFVAGQFLIGLYLGRGSVASVYGGAGSIVIVLLWTYYSGLILFFGAEVTAVFASRWGSRKGSAIRSG